MEVSVAGRLHRVAVIVRVSDVVHLDEVAALVSHNAKGVGDASRRLPRAVLCPRGCQVYQSSLTRIPGRDYASEKLLSHLSSLKMNT